MILLINTLLSNIFKYFKCRKLVHAQQSIRSQSSWLPMDVLLWTEKCIKNNLLHYSLLKVNSVVIKSQR